MRSQSSRSTTAHLRPQSTVALTHILEWRWRFSMAPRPPLSPKVTSNFMLRMACTRAQRTQVDDNLCTSCDVVLDSDTHVPPYKYSFFCTSVPVYHFRAALCAKVSFALSRAYSTYLLLNTTMVTCGALLVKNDGKRRGEMKTCAVAPRARVTR